MMPFVFESGLKAVENTGILFPMLRQLKLEEQAKLHKSLTATLK
jgi:hypothetical protein